MLDVRVVTDLNETWNWRHFYWGVFAILPRGRDAKALNTQINWRVLHEQITAHGFRTLTSTLLNEHGWPEEVVERQLAHIDNNRPRAAYNHAQHLPLRICMMQVWADYLDELRSDKFETGALTFQDRVTDVAF